eukprot:6114007-Pleurochrysis_carterae.AAC.1
MLSLWKGGVSLKVVTIARCLCASRCERVGACIGDRTVVRTWAYARVDGRASASICMFAFGPTRCAW